MKKHTFSIVSVLAIICMGVAAFANLPEAAIYALYLLGVATIPVVICYQEKRTPPWQFLLPAVSGFLVPIARPLLYRYTGGAEDTMVQMMHQGDFFFVVAGKNLLGAAALTPIFLAIGLHALTHPPVDDDPVLQYN